ncbi:MAG: arginine N-succinyltransferase [Planctomycetota bacterium]
MALIRPVCAGDLPALRELAALAGGQLSSLPVDADDLAKKIADSEAAFASDLRKPGGEMYQFVLLDDAGRLVGTANVVSKTGGFEPFYNYRLVRERFRSDRLGVDKEVRSLHLVREHDGPAEVGGLFLHPDARGGGMGRALSMARMQLMAHAPHRFDPRVVSEIRGKLRPDGTSAFWDAIGRHFFGVEFAVADALSLVEKGFVAELMPDHPIYLDMLPPEAQSVIGLELDTARPARRMLEGEGFAFRDHIDIFDAGPMLECELADVRSVRTSRTAIVTGIIELPGEPDHLIATNRVQLLATPSAMKMDGAEIVIPPATARLLDIDVGQRVRFAPLRAEVEATQAAAEMHDPYDHAIAVDAEDVVTTRPREID